MQERIQALYEFQKLWGKDLPVISPEDLKIIIDFTLNTLTELQNEETT